jgi:putative FmdB family regulatory protein
MPVYEYFCEACQREFERILSLHEHDESRIVCPKCGTDEVRQLMTAFTPVTSKKS